MGCSCSKNQLYEKKLYEQDKKIDNLLESQNQLISKIDELLKFQEKLEQNPNQQQDQDQFNINEEMQIYEQQVINKINNIDQVFEVIKENTNMLMQANAILQNEIKLQQTTEIEQQSRQKKQKKKETITKHTNQEEDAKLDFPKAESNIQSHGLIQDQNKPLTTQEQQCFEQIKDESQWKKILQQDDDVSIRINDNLQMHQGAAPENGDINFGFNEGQSEIKFQQEGHDALKFSQKNLNAPIQNPKLQLPLNSNQNSQQCKIYLNNFPGDNEPPIQLQNVYQIQNTQIQQAPQNENKKKIFSNEIEISTNILNIMQDEQIAQVYNTVKNTILKK